MIIATKDRFIHYLSEAYVGKTHDYSLLKAEFPPDKAWFANFTIRADSAYQGFASDYVCAKAVLPQKKPQGMELTDRQKQANKQKAQKRIWVEHSIGGMKRYRMLSDRLRIHTVEFYNQVLSVCAGLWNFSLTC